MADREPQGEHILEDAYPIYAGYWYIMDGEPKQSPLKTTAGALKQLLQIKEIRRCDSVARGLPLVPFGGM